MEHEQTSPEQRKGEETGPESDTASAAAEPATPTGSAEPAAAPRRRRGRTTLLIAGAAALGVLAGTVTGYAVQYHREPTALPPLAQQKVAMPPPVAPNDATSRRSVNASRWDKAEEDLAKKLLEAPGGAKDGYSGYESLDMFAADYYESPDRGFDAIAQDVRRIATAGWRQGEHDFIEIRLLQFQDQHSAQKYQEGQASYQDHADRAGNDGFALPGVPDDYGRAWLYKPKTKAGYHPLRLARAILRRGDIVMDVELTNNRGDVSQGEITDLAKRQMERL
ncbi:hypothetical protein AB0D66_25295 [Streptomyces sp. NPDC048270]|uniref:hypothetical protein n=1 Tax=Streptomyces sp. NPDC048270 TaxID=3154615 RepID=UPI0033D407D7